MAKKQVEDRRVTWQKLYSETLPSLAKAKSPTQKTWPVVLDHCFGRIILDHVIGDGKIPWDQRIKRPAIQNMTDEQLDACIELGRQIASGNANLVDLDEQSLMARGKKSKHFGRSNTTSGKRKRNDSFEKVNSEDEQKRQPPRKQQRGSEDDLLGSTEDSRDEDAIEEEAESSSTDATDVSAPHVPGKNQDRPLSELEALINSSPLAPYRKRVLQAMCQIPRGKFSTYGAMSDYLKSSPRAVGNGVRNNPFAPDVPCHRILAADGKIGGYCGQWAEGDLIDKKRKLLREEGVRFDGKGKVIGQPWRGFK